jgi:hypothetical protein
MARCWFFLKLVYIIFFFYQYIKTQGFCVFTRKLTSFFYSAIVCSAFSRTRFCWSVLPLLCRSLCWSFWLGCHNKRNMCFGFLLKYNGRNRGAPDDVLEKKSTACSTPLGQVSDASVTPLSVSPLMNIEANHELTLQRLAPTNLSSTTSLYHSTELFWHPRECGSRESPVQF